MFNKIKEVINKKIGKSEKKYIGLDDMLLGTVQDNFRDLEEYDNEVKAKEAQK